MAEFIDGRPVPNWVSGLAQRIGERDQPRQPVQPDVAEIVNPAAAARAAEYVADEQARRDQDAAEKSPTGWLGRMAVASDARTAQYRERREQRVEAYEARQRAAAVERYGITADDLESVDAA